MEKISRVIISMLLGLCFILATNNDAKRLEVLKVGGIDNYNKLVDLYKSDTYKEQQANAIVQFDAQLKKIDSLTNIEEQPIEE